MYAVGSSIHRRRAEGWEVAYTPAAGMCFHLGGTAPDDLWATRQDGLVVWDGSAWTRLEGQPLPGALHGFWADGGEVVAAGLVNEHDPVGGALHRLGGEWRILDTGTSAAIWSVHGSAGDFWAVGEEGTMRYFDGERWHSVWPGPAGTLNSVWRVGESLFVGAAEGLVLEGRRR